MKHTREMRITAMAKKALSAAVSVAMAAMLCPVVPAAHGDILGSYCGNNLTWAYSSDGTLTIQGSGAMDNYSSSYDTPWSTYTDDIKTVVVSGATSIGTHAFDDCDALTSVSLPSTLKTVGESAFRYCKALTSVSLPDSVTSVGSYAFGACWDLSSLKLPSNSGCTLCQYAFDACRSLKTVTIPAGVKTEENAELSPFSNSVLESAVFASGIKTIPRAMLFWCDDLTSVIIPEGVTTVDDYAFAECASLPSVNLPSTLTKIGDHAFYRCRAMKTVSLSSSIGSIGSSAFAQCASLTSVDLPAHEGLVLGTSCFLGCNSLEDVTVNSNIKIEEDFQYYDSTPFRGSGVEHVTVAEGVTELPKGLFRECSELEDVTLPSTLRVIGSYCFSTCSKLYSIGATSSSGNVLPSSLEEIAEYAFQNCSSLGRLTVLRSVTTFGKDCFAGLSSTCRVLLATNSQLSKAQSSCVSSTGASFELLEQSEADKTPTVSTLADVVYNGAAQKQTPKVTDSYGCALTLGTDYTLKYDTTDFTNAGTVTATVTGMGDFSGTVTRSYKITPAPLTVTTGSASKAYDGTALTCSEVKLEGLVAGETAGITATGSQTKVGSSSNTYSIVWAASGNNYTAKQANYAITEKLGTLSVGMLELKDAMISSPTDCTYDGTEHKWTPVVTDSGKTLVEGTDYAVAYSTDDFKDAGTVVVTISGKDHYVGTFTRTYKIAPRSYSVSTATASKAYDGVALASAAPTVTGLATGDTVGAVSTGSQTDAGSCENGYQLTWAAAGNSYTAKESNYVLKDKSLGTLTVTPAPVSVTTGSDTKTYDGLPLTSDVVRVGGIVAGETYGVRTTGSQTEAGSCTNTYEFTWAAPGNTYTAKQGNYTVTWEDLGTLTVESVNGTVVITTVGGSYTYDGGTHAGQVFVTGLPSGFSVAKAETDVAVKDVTSSPVAVTPDRVSILDAKGNDATKSLNIVYKIGTITINPAPLSISTGSATKEYDGTPLTCPDTTITGLIGTETAKVSAVGSQTEVGSSANRYEIEWGTAKEDNYYMANISTGMLTVTPVSLKENFVSKTEDYTYDGTPHAWTPVVTGPDGTELRYGVDYTVTYGTADLTNAGTVEVAVTGIGGYTGTVVRSYNILPREVSVTTGSATKAYDGAALTCDEAAVIGLVEGDTCGVEAQGSQTRIGFSSNGYAITWASDSNRFTALATNYKVTKEELGTLTISIPNTPITVTTVGGSFVFDCTKHVGQVVVGTLPEGLRVETATSSTAAYNVTSEPLTVEVGKLVIVDDQGTDVTSQLNLQYELGTLEVAPQKLGKARVAAMENVTWDMSAHKVKPVVTNAQGKVLKKGKDYTLSYSTKDFKSVQTIKVTVTGMGNYTSYGAQKYSIVEPEVGESVTIAGSKGSSVTYTRASSTIFKADSCEMGSATALKVGGFSGLGAKTVPSVLLSSGFTSNNTAVKKVTLGDDVTIIGSWAFAGCTNLTKVIAGTSLARVDKEAFYQCKLLGTVSISSSSLAKVSTDAFYGACTKATKVVVKAPTAKLAAYKKMLAAAGIPATKTEYKALAV